MKYYIFEASAGAVRGLTDDRSGARLPHREVDWTYDRSITLEHGGGPRMGRSSDEMIDAVERQGFYLWMEQTAE